MEWCHIIAQERKFKVVPTAGISWLQFRWEWWTITSHWSPSAQLCQVRPIRKCQSLAPLWQIQAQVHTHMHRHTCTQVSALMRTSNNLDSMASPTKQSRACTIRLSPVGFFKRNPMRTSLWMMRHCMPVAENIIMDDVALHASGWEHHYGWCGTACQWLRTSLWMMWHCMPVVENIIMDDVALHASGWEHHYGWCDTACQWFRTSLWMMWHCMPVAAEEGEQLLPGQNA
jgi:hypothetical protein